MSRTGWRCALRSGVLPARATLYSTLARRSERVACMLADGDSAGGTLRVRSGQGRQERRTYLAAGLRTAAGLRAARDAWLALRGSRPGPLFVPLTTSAKATLR